MASGSSDKQFDPHAWTLKDVIENNFFEVPIYQRPYTWSNNEVNCLLNDLFDAYKARTNDSVYFTGQLFLRKQGKGSDGLKDKYEVVDGQQRLTTFSMILLSILSIAIQRGYKIDEKDIADLRSFLWKYTRSTKIYNKDERLITLSSIDKKLFVSIFDSAYDNAEKMMEVVANFECKCYTERNLVAMLENIYSRIQKEIPDDPNNRGEIISFYDFLLERTQFIAIQSSLDMPHVFSVFESINSKGKPLDEIDKIKTYIFSELKESDYSDYLTRWGQLIIKTNDCLGDYLQIYVRAYLSYYRNRINLTEFKTLARSLLTKYGVTSKAEALKTLIDRMLEKADYYALLQDSNKICNLIDKPEFTTFYRLYTCMGYSHPKALFFRALCEFSSEEPIKMSKKDITTIVKSATLFMFKFQSIKGGDSKDAIKYFESISVANYSKAKLDAQTIAKHFNDALIKEGVDIAVIRSSFSTMDFYSKHDLAYCILSLLESIDESKNNKLLFSQASMMMSHIKDQTFHVDHMLPQKPDKDNAELKYYCDNSSGEELLALKSGHDFPADTVVNGMKYAEFESRTLHRLGNIRLYIPQLNESRGNEVAHLPEHEDFTTYKQVAERSMKLADLLLNSPDLK